MGFKEWLGVPKTEKKKPSDQLNEVFTSLMQNYSEKIGSENAKIREPFLRKRDPSLGIEFGIYPKIYTLSDAQIEQPHNWIVLRSPIGEYGDTWSTRLVTAGHSLINELIDSNSQVQVNLKEETKKVNRKHKKLLDIYTFRTSSSPANARNRHGGSETSIAEAFQSTLFAAGFFTQYKVPGYEDNPQGLLNDLSDQGVFSQLSLVIRPTVTATMGSSGVVFTSPTIIHDAGGRLRIRPDIIKHFHEGGVGKYLTTQAKKSLDRPGCPVGRKLPGVKESGVDIAAKLFAKAVSAQGEL